MDDGELVANAASEKRSMRPSTARRRPPKLKEAGEEEVVVREEKKAAPVGIMVDGALRRVYINP